MSANKNYIPAREAAKIMNRTAGSIKRWCRDGAPHKRDAETEAYLVCVEDLGKWRKARSARVAAARRGAVEAAQAAAGTKAETSGSPPAPREVSEERPPEPKKREPQALPEASAPAQRRRKRRAVGTDRGRAERVHEEAENVAYQERDPELVALRRAVSFNKALSSARSISVLRMPSGHGDEISWGAAGVEAYVGFSREDLEEAVDKGGVEWLLTDRLGPGRYQVASIGPGCAPYPAREITIPNLARVYDQFQAEEEARRSNRAAEKKAAKRAEALRLREERQAAELQRREHQQAADQAAWGRDVAAGALAEGVARLRFSEAAVLGEIKRLGDIYAREQAAQGRQARALAGEVRRLRQQRDRLVRDRERLRAHYSRIGKEPCGSLEPVVLESIDDEDPGYPRRPDDSFDRWLASPLIAELDWIRNWDPHALRDQILDHLEGRAGELFPTPLHDPRLLHELEPLLPPVPPGFLPWLAVLQAGPPRRLSPAGPGWAPHSHAPRPPVPFTHAPYMHEPGRR